MKKRIKLSWGKIRRVFLVYLKPRKAKKYLAQRNGECHRCGTCCELIVHCPALVRENGLASCKLYGKLRTRVCKTFPLNERDIKDRDLVNPIQKCGFSFNNGH
ncbi:MAG: hypothetical protein V1871_07095 [Planctomycetota bacterium]